MCKVLYRSNRFVLSRKITTFFYDSCLTSLYLAHTMWQKIRLLTGDRMSNRLLEGKSPDNEEDYEDDAECEETRRLMEMVRRIVTMTDVSIYDKS